MGNVDKNTENLPQDLVVVGSSAGGIEALSALVHSLPHNFPAPVVLAQHLDPHRTSLLDQILRKQTNLPIEVVTNHSELKPGTIYVIPANYHVSISASSVHIHNTIANKKPRPSVDTLFTTAANAFGDRLIAVILTGSGFDGTMGAIDVKNAGGTVIIQDPATAHDPSMPQALPSTIVDFITPTEHIGPLLMDLLSRTHITPSEEHTDAILQEILELVSRQSSIDFRAYKTTTILRRIGRRMTVTQHRTMREYADYLRTTPDEVGKLVKAFLINVTQFFRDTAAFTFLKQEILPTILSRARQQDRVLRFWSAGCATGEEPYSLAMLLTDMLGAELSQWSIKIFATDIDESAINFARRGLYSENMLKGMPFDYRDRFFEHADHNYRITKTLRQMVIFGQQDLSKSSPFPRINMVMCRNVLIYFTPELQEYVLNQFAFSLSSNGYLFLGKAETVRPVQSNYELVNKQWKVYRCIKNTFPSLRYRANPHVPTSQIKEKSNSMDHSQYHRGKPQPNQEVMAPSLEIGQIRRFNELLLRFLPVGVVVINRSYHILTANSSARRLLGLRDITGEQDFLHSVHGIPYQETRAAIDSVFRERTLITLPEVALDINTGGNGRFMSFSIALMQLESGATDLAILSITDVTEQIQTRHQLETTQAEQRQLMNELGSANKRLSDVNKELMDANEELQATNEELVLTHEELQASIEEFETTNEELQATNEELETSNEELQATNEELETTNDELRARTAELQEITSVLESERVRLSEMVELAPYYILVLHGHSLTVEAFNPRYARILEGRSAQGHPLNEVVDLFWANEQTGTTIVRAAREVYRQGTERIIPRMLTYLPHQPEADDIPPPSASYFTYTLIPAHDANGLIDGVIIYAVDETAQRYRDAQQEQERLKTIFDNTSTALLALFNAQSAKLLMGSPRYLEIISQHNSSREILGNTWHDINMLPAHYQINQIWEQVLTQRTPFRIPEVSYVPPGQNIETIWDYTLTPVMSQEEPTTVCYMLVSALEITEQVQARKTLEQVDAMKDDFLALATHELRTPLTSMLANTQLLRRNVAKLVSTGEQDSRQSLVATLDRMVHQLNRVNRLIGEIADATRIYGSLFKLQYQEQVNLLQLARDVVDDFSSEHRNIALHLSTETASAAVDTQRIEQALTNLIENAIKYSSSPDPITVSVVPDPHTPETLLFSIQDHGIGISPEDQSLIFNRFFRVHDDEQSSHHTSLGLGLYITRTIIEQHGGRIWLESVPQHGTTFFFTLPLKASEQKKEQTRQDERRDTLPPGTSLH